MANKQLTAKVRLNADQAEKKLDNLINKINRLNKLSSKAGNNNVNSQLEQANNKVKKIVNNVKQIDNATRQVATTTSRIGTYYAKVASLGTTIRGKVAEWWANQNGVLSATRSTNSALGSVWSKLKAIASTYLGIMGMRAVVQTSDTITSAENKLNYLNGGNTNATQESMDKMYNSAQKVRMAYADMMGNVSKSMTLAGSAFDDNIDNAIRFQEIMAEAYAVGGASAAEMSSSMYQMIQALGSGILQGDELRSVREGAPLAYKAIEEFAQGVYKTEESLKDLASQGKITSDIVVAAIMNAGTEMDNAFNQTHQTFAQTWAQIKNIAVKAFEPVSHMLRDELNAVIDDGLIGKIENVFVSISKALQIVGKLVINTINWIAENWDWLKHLIVAGLLIIGGMWLWQAGVAVLSAIATILAMGRVQATILIVMATILALIFVFYLWKTGAIDTCQAIVAALMIVGAAILLIGIIFNATTLIIIGAILIVLALLFMFLEQVCGIGWVIFTFIGNLVQSILNIIVTVIAVIIATVYNAIALIVNYIMALVNWIGAAAENIEIALTNAWHGATAAFWQWVSDILNGTSTVAKAVSKVAELFGLDGISIDAKISNAKSKVQDYNDLSAAWSKGWNTMDFMDYGSTINQVKNTFGTGLSDWSMSDAYNTGANFGAGLKESINAWGSKFQNQTKENESILDNLGEKLGLDFDDKLSSNAALNSTIPDYSALTGTDADPLGGSGGKAGKSLGNIDDNTGKIADSMDLTQEDLAYLRDIANMEWKKEFTTAQIHVDMSNYNTVNGDSDLDGIVTRLTDKLYEELSVVADGVYAY